MTATKENTVVCTVCTYNKESQIEGFLFSARKHDIFVHVLDWNQPWKGFFHHKVVKIQEHMRQFLAEGKEYFLLLDSRDVFFADPLEIMLAKMNGLPIEDKVCFTAEYCYHRTWPCASDALRDAIFAAHGEPGGILNAGCIGGKIVNYLALLHEMQRMQEDFLTERSRYLCRLLYEVCDAKWCANDDQFFYSICSVYFPHLFHIDAQKELFANMVFDKSISLNHRIREDIHSDRNPGNASILHITGARYDSSMGHYYGLVEQLEK